MSTMTVQSWVEVSCITIHSPVYFGFPITSIFFCSNTVPILALNLGLSMYTLAFKTAIYPLLPSPIAVHCCVRWHTALDVNRLKKKREEEIFQIEVSSWSLYFRLAPRCGPTAANHVHIQLSSPFRSTSSRSKVG